MTPNNSTSSRTDLHGAVIREWTESRTAVWHLHPAFTLVVRQCRRPRLVPEDQARRCSLLSRPRLLSILNPFWAAGATVIARDGRFVATLTPAPDGLVQLGLYERPGRYRVEISRPGYRSQVLESVRVVEEGCNVQTVRVAAALAPAI
jgi:hypothetical protein